MNLTADLSQLATHHPRLLWDEIGAALVAVFLERGSIAPFEIELSVENVSGFSDRVLQLRINTGELAEAHIERLRRTYDPPRLVELAAIAIAGLAMYHAGNHVIHDISMRGTAADYLVDEQNYLLEIAGRSRRSDLVSAWQQKIQRLRAREDANFFVCVVEFETPGGRIAFFEEWRFS